VDCCVQIDAPAGLAPEGFLRVGRVDDVVLRSELEFLTRRAPGTAARSALLNLRATAALLQLLELGLTGGAEKTDLAGRHARAAARHIQEHYARIGSVAEIAAALGLGADHLRHVFRRHHGRGLAAYLGDVRMERARTLLTHAELPIKEIAKLCGYRDEYYFSAVFTRRTKLAPGRYRERSRAGRA
ncbi:MAG: helix-turn-helix transcriptional regulator, partial [Burkholderiales bacterium]|nr:helix-turn-helix transcriptional regulator [Opitutaceae bacterium]